MLNGGFGSFFLGCKKCKTLVKNWKHILMFVIVFSKKKYFQKFYKVFFFWVLNQHGSENIFAGNHLSPNSPNTWQLVSFRVVLSRWRGRVLRNISCSTPRALTGEFPFTSRMAAHRFHLLSPHLLKNENYKY